MSLLLPAAVAATPVGVIWLSAFRASRATRRNRAGQCGACGGPLYAPTVVEGPSLIEGHLTCEPCAAKARRTLTRSLIAAAVITGTAVLALAAVAVWAPTELGAHPWLPAIVTAVTYPLLFAGAIAWMKRANRRAAQCLAAPAPPFRGGPARHV